MQLLQALESAKQSQEFLNRTLEQAVTQQNDLEEVIKTLEQQVYSTNVSVDALEYAREKPEADKLRERGLGRKFRI